MVLREAKARRPTYGQLLDCPSHSGRVNFLVVLWKYLKVVFNVEVAPRARLH